MNTQNILISSASAKVLLVQAFKEATRGIVATCDTAACCAAGLAADSHFQVRRLDAPGALEELLTICSSAAIDLLVPTRDGELAFYSQHIEAFRAIGTQVLVAPMETLNDCQDKRAFGQALQHFDLPAIPVIHRSDAILPAFIRPVRGAAGVGTRKITTADELNALDDSGDFLLHPFIQAREFSIDLLMQLDGKRALQAICRERVSVVNGESKISRVVNLPRLEEMSCRLGEALGLVGHNTIQAFVMSDGEPMFIEVNPRFGGASNLSIQAGLDSPRRILGMLSGDASVLEKRSVRYGATLYRYSADFIVEAET